MYFVQLLQGKVMKLNQIKEAQNIKAQGFHDTTMIIHWNYCQKNVLKLNQIKKMEKNQAHLRDTYN